MKGTRSIGIIDAKSRKLTNPNLYKILIGFPASGLGASPCVSSPLGSTGGEETGLGIISNWRTAEMIQLATGKQPRVITPKSQIVSIKATASVTVINNTGSDGFFNMRGCRVFTNDIDFDGSRSVASVGGSSSNTAVPAGAQRSKTVSFNWTNADITQNALKYLGFWVSGNNVGIVTGTAEVFMELAG